MICKSLRLEYKDGATDLRETLRQHTVYCLYNDFDQIRQTDKLLVECCECGKKFRVPFNEVATRLFCDECEDTEMTMEHYERMQARLQEVRNKLLYR